MAVGARPVAVDPAASDVELLGLAWFAGTFVPFVLLSLIDSRTSYLYYMVIVMPGIYVVRGAVRRTDQAAGAAGSGRGP